MSFKAIGHRLPRLVSEPLFGDRDKYGYQPSEKDPCWIEYKQVVHGLYNQTQREGIGKTVNDAGYRILECIELDGLKVLEVGPGNLHHLKFWTGVPSKYVLIDLYQDFLQTASQKLAEKGIPFETRLTSREHHGSLPSLDSEFDLIISFYSFEHLYPFSQHLHELRRVLKPGGMIMGAIPAEGGLGWGFGRMLTTRRWFKRNTNINPDKIISWEHPNMADEILNSLESLMERDLLAFWPTRVPSIDLNLVIKFIFRKTQ